VSLCFGEGSVQIYRIRQVSRGAVQSLQGLAATYAGMVEVFCVKLNWWQLQALVSSFQDRLEEGAQPDVVKLARVPHVKTVRARALKSAGIASVEALSQASVEEVAEALKAVTPFRLSWQTPERLKKTELTIAKRIIDGAQESVQAQRGRDGN